VVSIRAVLDIAFAQKVRELPNNTQCGVAATKYH
jgi:hypothetical protein